jgi:D-amino peptidase
MNVFISVDMEGCAGIVHTDQTRRGGHDYERARRLMTLEAGAAAMGAFDAGAERVLINDSHADMRNLLLDELPAQVEVILGSLKPLSMVQGLEAFKADAALFVGYHGGAGTAASVLDHTYYGAVVGEVRLFTPGDSTGVVVDEAAINALVAGTFDVPVAMVTGDHAVTDAARERFANVMTVAVKRSITRFAAQSMHPDEARRRIRATAQSALHESHLALLRPYWLRAPLTLSVSMLTTGYADAAELVPGVTRADARRVQFQARDPREMLRALITITKIAGTVVT